MQAVVIVNDDTRVFEVTNISHVSLKTIQQPLSSNQLWYRKCVSGEEFLIISMGDKKALKCVESQIVLCDISEGDKWKMDGNNIVHTGTSKLMYFDEHDLLYCGDKNSKEVKQQKKNAFTFQKVVCRC